ncbi:hypothetical protein [Fusobacterium varium]|uniref:Uncharacterized protein n=1 Tax=Fusobacterium varium ATCC 27725 TaxID=469618 RepID=A0ABN5JMR0_FUSVA|nr:hypothetical protein [Fusobacterium varium]AVQ32631.1 hypothetical protein C4N18_15400 [Fusobacterium varium ATCC 27725]
MKVKSMRFIKPMYEIKDFFPDYKDKDWVAMVYNDNTPKDNVAIFPCNRMLKNFLKNYNLTIDDVKDTFIRAEAVPYHPIKFPLTLD